MYNCGNCGNEFDDRDDGLVVSHKGEFAAAICPTCTQDTKAVKIVLRRGPADQFKYEQYNALEVLRKSNVAR